MIFFSTETKNYIDVKSLLELGRKYLQEEQLHEEWCKRNPWCSTTEIVDSWFGEVKK